MKVHIILDIRLIERQEHLFNELARQGITDFKIWPIVEDSSSVIRSINLSHKQIVQWAKDNNLPEVCILEDDVWFPASDGWYKFIEGIPKMPFDIYLGGAYGLSRPVSHKMEHINGFHCYIVRERFYDTFLGVPENVHIDVAMDNLGAYFVSYPFTAIQRPFWSSNTRTFSDKNTEFNDSDVYGGLSQ